MTTTTAPQSRSAPMPFYLRFAGAVTSSAIAAACPMAWTAAPVLQARTQPTSAPVALARWADYAVAISASPPVRTLAASVNELRAMSGLTVDQIARLLGVSRRSVHKWMNGGSLDSIHAERLGHLMDVVRALPQATPESRRAALLASSGGPSLFYRLSQELPEPAVIQGNAISARDRIAL